jgi:hypothetical protein
MKRIDEPVGNFLKSITYARGSAKTNTMRYWIAYNIWLRTDTDLSFREWYDTMFLKPLEKSQKKQGL